MRHLGFIGCVLSGLLLAAAGSVCGQDAGGGEGLNEKAGRYYKLLLKRPENRTLYERFYDAWLDEGTKEGLDEFLKAEANSGGAAEWRLLAVYHQQGGHDEEALQALDRAVEEGQAEPELLLTRAKVNGRLLRFEEAIADLRRIVEKDPFAVEAADALKLEGQFLARAGRPEEAVKVWQGLLEANPNDEELAEDLVEMEIGEGLYEEALAAATKLAEGSKDAYQRALRRLRVGEIEALLGRRDDAVATYTQVLESTGQGSWLEREVLAQIDELFRREDDMEGLRAFYEKTAEAQPQRLQVRRTLAQLTADAGEMDEAVAKYREMMRLAPGDRTLREELVSLLADHGREDDAIVELEKLLQSDGDNAVWWERLAALRKRMDDREGMRAALREVDRLAGPDEAARLQVAALYERFGLREVAGEILREAAEGGTLEAQEALAVFLIEGGRDEEAVAQWRRIAEGADLDGLMRVGRSLQARGKQNEAFELLAARRDEFGRDPVSLAMFCQAAQMAGKPDEALAEARRLVAVAGQPTELHDAVTTAARLIMRAGEEEAVLEEIRAARPHVNDLCLAAELLELIGDSRAADAMLARAREAGGGVLAQTQNVQLLERRGDFVEAAEAMRVIVESEQNRPIYRKRLVNLLRRAGESEAALAEIGRWKQATPGDKVAWQTEADVLLEAGRPDEAVTVLRRAQARFGREEDIRTHLAAAYIEAGESAAARRVFERLYEEAEQTGDKVRWAARMAELAQQEGEIEELVKQFERRKRTNPQAVTPLLALAEIHRTLDQYEERRAALDEASRRRPEDVDLRIKLARVDERAGEFDRAVETLREAQRQDSGEKVRRELARLLLYYGETEEALATLRELADRNNDPREVEATVEALLAVEEWRRAEEHLARYLPRFPADWRLRYLMGLCVEESGGPEAAADWFLEVVPAEEPLPGVTPLVPAKDRAEWGRLGGQALPERLVRLNLMTAYQRYARAPAQMNYGGTRAKLPLPGDAEEARAMAVCRLVANAAKLPEEARGALAERMKSGGVEDVELMITLIASPSEVGDVINAQLEETPDDRTLLLLLLSWPLAEEEDWEAKWRVRARDVFREDLPLMALFANMELIAADDEEARAQALEALPGLLENLERDEREHGLNAVASLLSAGEGAPVQLSDPQRETLYQVLLEGYRKCQVAPPQWNPLEDHLVSYAASRDRYGDVIEIMNRACGEPAPQPAASSRRGTRMRYPPLLYRVQYRWQQQIRQRQMAVSSMAAHYHQLSGPAIVPYPPNPATVPPALVEKFPAEPGVEDPRLEAFLRKHAVAAPSLDAEALVSRIEQIEDPLLRLLILEHADRDEELEEALAAIEAKDEPLVDELLFAAGYHAREPEGERKALELLVRARALPVSSQEAADLDSTLLILGAELAERDELSDGLRRAAKRAGLRARRSGFAGAGALGHSSSQRQNMQRVATALAKLGIDTPNRPSARVIRPRSSRSNQPGAKIGELLREGKREAAVRLARRDLHASLRPNRRQPHYPYIGMHGIRGDGLPQVIAGLGLAEDVIKESEPGEGAGVAQWERFVRLCQLLDQPESARGALERILAEEPDNRAAKARLLLLTPEDERPEAIGDLALGEDAIEVLEEMWSSGSAGNDFEASLERIGMLATLLEAIEPDGAQGRNLTFVNYGAMQLLQFNSFDGTRVRQLTAGKEEDKEDSEETKQWHAAYTRLCRAMLHHPQTAEQGFMLLYHTSKGRGAETTELEKEAMQAVRAVAKDEADPNSYHTQNRWVLQTGQGSYSSSGGMSAKVPAPLEYLVGRAAEQGRPELLDGLLDREDADENLKKRIAAYRDVLTKEGKARIEAFNALWEVAKSGRGAGDFPMGLEYLLNHAGEDPEFLARVGELLCDFGGGENTVSYRPYRYQTVHQALPVYGAKLLELEGTDAFDEFLLTTSESLLGKRSEWDLVEEVKKLGVAQALQQKLRTYESILQVLIQDPGTALPTARFLARTGLHRFALNNLQHYLSQSIRRRTVADAAEAETLFAEAGFLVGVEDFDPVSLAGRADQMGRGVATVLGSLCDGLRSGPNESMWDKVGAEWVKATGQGRFGKRLVGAAVNDEPSDNAEVVAKELVANREAIAKLPADQQVSLAHYLTRWFGEDLREDTFPREIYEWRGTISEGAQMKARERIEGWLKKGFGQIDRYETRDRVGQMVATTMSGEPELAARLVARLVRDLRQARAAGVSMGSSYSNGLLEMPWDDAIEDMSYRWRNRQYPVASMVRFLDALLKQPEAEDIDFNGVLLEGLREAVDKTANAVWGRDEIQEIDELEEQIPAGWKAIAEELMKDLSDEQEAIVAAGLANHVGYNWRVVEERVPIFERTVEELAESRPLLAAALKVGVMVKRSDPAGDEARKAGRAAVADFLRREEIPSELKVGLISRLDDWAIGGEAAGAVAVVLLDYANGQRNVITSSMARLLGRLSESAAEITAEDASALYERFDELLGNRGASTVSPAQSPFDRPMLQLALWAGKEQEVARLTSGRNSPFAGDLELIRRVVLANRWELAERLLPDAGEFAKPSDGHFDRALEESLTTFLPRLEDDEERYRIEVLFAGLPDAGDELKPETSRPARLARLAERFAEAGPEVPAARLEVLAILAEAPNPPEALQREAIEEARKISLAYNIILGQSYNSQTDAAMRREAQLRAGLVSDAVRMELAAGSADLANEQLEALVTGLKGDRSVYQLSNAIGSLLGDIALGLAAGMAKENGPEPEVCLPIATRVFRQGLELAHKSRQIGPNALALGVVAHALAGAGEEFDLLVAGLPEKERETVETIRKEHGLRGMFGYWDRSERWSAAHNAAVRRAVLRALLVDEATCNREITHMTDLTVLIDSNAFTRQDVMEVIGALPETHPRRAEFILEKAGILGWRERNEEAAMESYALATRLAEEQKNDALLSQCRAYHARYSAQVLQQPARAVELAKEVNPDLLVEKDRKWFGSESAQWRKAAEKAE